MANKKQLINSVQLDRKRQVVKRSLATDLPKEKEEAFIGKIHTDQKVAAQKPTKTGNKKKENTHKPSEEKYRYLTLEADTTQKGTDVDLV